MADPRGDDGIADLRKLVTSLAQTVGHLDASYKSVQQTLDGIRSDLRDLRAAFRVGKRLMRRDAVGLDGLRLQPEGRLQFFGVDPLTA